MVLAGGAEFVWPVIQDFEYIDLATFEYPLEGDVNTKDEVTIQLSGLIKYGVSNNEQLAQNAATRLLGKSKEEIELISNDLINFQLGQFFSEKDVVEVATLKNSLPYLMLDHINEKLHTIGVTITGLTFEKINDAKMLDFISAEISPQKIIDFKTQTKLSSQNITQAEVKLFYKPNNLFHPILPFPKIL